MANPETLILYSRSNCPLCDEGLETVEALARRHDLKVRKVDIDSDAALIERHGDRVPVLEWRGEELGWGRLSARAIERKLATR